MTRNEPSRPGMTHRDPSRSPENDPKQGTIFTAGRFSEMALLSHILYDWRLPNHLILKAATAKHDLLTGLHRVGNQVKGAESIK
jgi:hypothetical protein